MISTGARRSALAAANPANPPPTMITRRLPRELMGQYCTGGWLVLPVSIPAENALSPGVDVGEQQENHENNQLYQHDAALGVILDHELWENGGKGVEEDDVHIDHQEDHGDNIEAHVEALVGIANRNHAAF